MTADSLLASLAFVRTKAKRAARKAKAAEAENSTPQGSYPKRYWWLILFVLPIALILAKELPELIDRFKANPNVHAPPGTITINNMVYVETISILEAQFEEANHAPLQDGKVKEDFQRASTLAKAGSYKEAITVLEGIAPQAGVAAVFNNLGVLRASSGDAVKAREAFETAKSKGPANKISEGNEKVARGLPINLLARDNGGQVVLAPNDDWWKTIDGQEDSSGLIFRIGSSAVYAFKDERAATFDSFALLVPHSGDHPKEFELLAGDESPTGAFRSIGKFTVTNAKLMKSPYQEFKFLPVTAKYLKVILLSTYHYNGWIELYEFRLMGQLKT